MNATYTPCFCTPVGHGYMLTHDRCPQHGRQPAVVMTNSADPKPTITEPCGCDMPVLFGHDTDCMLHPAPIASEPLQLLIAATELIDNQPTAEQWQTIKKAIRALAALDATARSE